MSALRNRLKKRSKPLRIDPSRFESLPSDEKETQLFEVAYQDTELARKLAACVVSQCFGVVSWVSPGVLHFRRFHEVV